MKSHSAAHAVNKNLQFCNEPFSCSCCNQYLMFWSNKMKSYSAAIAVNKNLQFMQYTLSTLLSSFPWTTQKSIIVENSKIVENFGATIFSTIMEFDCISETLQNLVCCFLLLSLAHGDPYSELHTLLYYWHICTLTFHHITHFCFLFYVVHPPPPLTILTFIHLKGNPCRQ